MNLKPCFYVALVLFLFSPAAHAYLDPSTGSMIITAIVGLFASIALAIKTYWYKLKSFFTGKGKKQDPTPGSVSEDPPGEVHPETDPQAHASRSPEEHS